MGSCRGGYASTAYDFLIQPRLCVMTSPVNVFLCNAFIRSLVALCSNSSLNPPELSCQVTVKANSQS